MKHRTVIAVSLMVLLAFTIGQTEETTPPQPGSQPQQYDALDSIIHTRDFNPSETRNKAIIDDWEIMKRQRVSKAGIFLFSVGSSLLFIHEIIGAATHQLMESSKRYPLLGVDLAVIGASIPLLCRGAPYHPMLSLGADDTIHQKSIRNSRFELGFFAGVSSATIAPLDFEFDDYYNRDYGVALSVSMLYKFNNFIGFQTGVAMQQKGCEIDSEGVQKTVSLDYVELPTGLRAMLPFKNGWRFSARAGLSPAILIKNEVRLDSSNEMLVLEGLTKSDLNLFYGVAIDVKPVRRVAFCIEFITSDGLFKLGSTFTDLTPRPKNRNFAIVAGMFF